MAVGSMLKQPKVVPLDLPQGDGTKQIWGLPDSKLMFSYYCEPPPVIWKAHSTDRTCLRRRWFNPVEVRRDSSVRRGVALAPLALPPACCLPDHRKEGLCLEKKRGHSYKVDGDGTACN